MNFIKDFLNKIKPTFDDTAIDRVHYVYTCLTTTLLALTVGLYQFGGWFFFLFFLSCNVFC